MPIGRLDGRRGDPFGALGWLRSSGFLLDPRASLIIALGIASVIPVVCVGALRRAIRLFGKIILIVAIELIVAATALIFEAGPILAQHTEIMICELIIIFAHHAIALHLGITSQSLVLFVKLVGIAARAVIYPVAAIISRIDTIGPRPAPAPTATVVLTIINQRLDVLVMVVI